MHQRHRVFTHNSSLRMSRIHPLPLPMTMMEKITLMASFYLAITSITYAVLVPEGMVPFRVCSYSCSKLIIAAAQSYRDHARPAPYDCRGLYK